MLYHNIKQSADKRILKNIIEYQEQSDEEGTWYHEFKNIMEKFNINKDKCMEMSKGQWRSYIKKKINEELEGEIKLQVKT